MLNDDMKQYATKKVRGFFKDVEMTREEFITKWARQIDECQYLCDSVEENKQLTQATELVRTLAGRKWDRIK